MDECHDERIVPDEIQDLLENYYVKALMKMNIEASAFPPNIQSQEERESWAQEYEQHPDEVVFFIFATQSWLDRLRKYKNWTADGTLRLITFGIWRIHHTKLINEDE